MKERPILFSGSMVRAILDGRKTQTRRVVKHPEYFACLTGDCEHWKQLDCKSAIADFANENPHGSIGDRLWVKETFAVLDKGLFNLKHPDSFLYACDPKTRQTLHFRPSIFMPRWASRITLEITGVRVERLKNISEADAVAEGAKANVGLYISAKSNYWGLWDSINGKKHPWNDNPWVWVISFRKL